MIQVQTCVVITNLLRILFYFLSINNRKNSEMLVQVHPQVTLPPRDSHGYLER